jgi:hypothetical protein
MEVKENKISKTSGNGKVQRFRSEAFLVKG